MSITGEYRRLVSTIIGILDPSSEKHRKELLLPSHIHMYIRSTYSYSPRKEIHIQTEIRLKAVGEGVAHLLVTTGSTGKIFFLVPQRNSILHMYTSSDPCKIDRAHS
jgi:hypothetical protein